MKIEQLMAATHHALDVGTNRLRRSLSRTVDEESRRTHKSLTLQCFPALSNSKNVLEDACEYSHPLYRARKVEGRGPEFTSAGERGTLGRRFVMAGRRAADPVAEQIREEQDVFNTRSGKLKEVVEENEKRIAKLKALIKKERLRRKFSETSSKENLRTFEQLASENRRLLRNISLR